MTRHSVNLVLSAARATTESARAKNKKKKHEIQKQRYGDERMQ